MTFGSASTPRISTRFAAFAAALALALCAGLLAGCQGDDSATSSSSVEASASASTAASSATEATGSEASDEAGSEAAAIEVSLTIDATEGNGEKSTEAVSVTEGSTVLDALQASKHAVDTQDSAYGAYVVAIDGLASGDVADMSGWMVAVNGEDLMVSADSQEVQAGDSIEWRFVTSFE